MTDFIFSSCSYSGHLSVLFNYMLDNKTIEHLTMVNAGEPGRGNKWIAHFPYQSIRKNKCIVCNS